MAKGRKPKVQRKGRRKAGDPVKPLPLRDLPGMLHVHEDYLEFRRAAGNLLKFRSDPSLWMRMEAAIRQIEANDRMEAKAWTAADARIRS